MHPLHHTFVNFVKCQAIGFAIALRSQALNQWEITFVKYVIFQDITFATVPKNIEITNLHLEHLAGFVVR